MIDGGVALATAALVMCVWNIGLARQVITKKWNGQPDDHSSISEHDGEAAHQYESLADILRRAKRREHFAGLAPGALTPAPYRSMFYGGCGRYSSRRASLTSSQHSTGG